MTHIFLSFKYSRVQVFLKRDLMCFTFKKKKKVFGAHKATRNPKLQPLQKHYSMRTAFTKQKTHEGPIKVNGVQSKCSQ